MTVREMLERISARELTEWAAYELVYGPLGRQYSDDMLASIHEAIQLGNRIAGAQFKTNPAGQPKHVPRPWELEKEAKRSSGFDH